MAVTPSKHVSSGFYRLHLWVLMGPNTLAALAVYSQSESLAGVLTDWDVSGMQPFSEDYVAGFTVEACQLALEPAFGEAKAIFDAHILGAVRRDIGGNHQRVSSVSTRYDDVTFKHILLPVWVSARPLAAAATVRNARN